MKKIFSLIISYAWKLITTVMGWCKKSYDWYLRTFKRLPWYGRIGMGIGSCIIGLIVLLIMIDLNFLWLFGKSPSMFNIKDPIQHVASEIYSSDGKLIGKYYSENRTPVEYKEISPILIKTLVYTEDERFYQHFGIDFEGVFAAAKDFITQGDARGASTITQQLVKNLFKVRSQYSTGLLGHIPGVKLLIMKAKEWVTAVKIEMLYSKEEILTMYFNTVDFGSNAYGIKTACHTYFNTTPDKVTVEQAATLIGLLKATTYYNPRINPKNSLARRNVVLGKLYEHHFLNKEQLDSIRQLPTVLHYKQETETSGNALYFRNAVAQSLKDWCKENDIDLYGDGLKIYTTIDSRMQQYAEEAVNKQMHDVQKKFDVHWANMAPWRDRNGQELPHFIEDLAAKTPAYKYLEEKYRDQQDSIDYYLNLPHRCKVFDYNLGQKDTTLSTMDSIRYMVSFMHCGFVAIDPHSGQVKAWVGDIDFKSWKYDKVLSKRQPGSTFKLFVYAEAMNQGLSPCDLRVDENVPWEVEENGQKKYWMPHNANGGATLDTFSLKMAFAQSVNTIAANVAHEVGIPNIVKTAKAMGIKTPLDEIPALSLGASDVSLLELVSAYGTVVNDGVAIDPILVTRIEDRDGKVIYKAQPQETKALPYASAYLMQQMLRGGLTCPGGTSQALWRFKIFDKGTEFGGKTGTSSNHSDAWFVGVSPNLVGGAWVGGEYRSIHFRTGELGQGSRTALPVFGYFMEKVLADPQLSKDYVAKFPPAKEKLDRSWDCNTYLPHYTDSDSLSIALGDSLMLEDDFDLDKLEKTLEKE
ncbi:transglycosylase domain-containing protein [uncultured Bacteroides sp.]|uniref:transglycosylase domain-containing protein n=1 Tax=uncultured Bacteroides sp. TaxID=162156 RepID=UPI0026308A1E|nr:transglycosylase domain-containing protein [uncultured Bacteroides sp.]